MDEEEVEVVDTPVSELLLADGEDVLLGVEGVPELEEIVSSGIGGSGCACVPWRSGRSPRA